MRQADVADEPFLDGLYITTRIEEVLSWGFPPEAARAFLVGQARVQRRAYALQFSVAEHNILLEAGRAVGRLIIAADPPALRVVDISVLPEIHGRGLGTWALEQVLARATRGHAPVRLTTLAAGPARRLYHRLGFQVTAASEDGLLAMEWLPE
ncbi:MAG TPA: GNAT family N-acetyltransferase [Polyangia bacterium]